MPLSHFRVSILSLHVQCSFYYHKSKIVTAVFTRVYITFQILLEDSPKVRMIEEVASSSIYFDKQKQVCSSRNSDTASYEIIGVCSATVHN